MFCHIGGDVDFRLSGFGDIVVGRGCFIVLLNYRGYLVVLYRVIHKSLRDFRTRLRNNQDRHDRKHINRWRISPSFCPSLQVLDMCPLGDAADVNQVPATRVATRVAGP